MKAKKNGGKIEKDLTKGNLFKQIILFALPLIFTSVLQQLFNTADIAVLGKFSSRGDLAVAGVGSTTSLVSLLTGLVIGLSIGVNVTLSQAIGANNEERTKKIVGATIPLGLVCGGILIAVGQIFARPMLELMGSKPNVIELSVTYIRIYFLGMPFTVLYNYFSAIMRASGDTKRPLIYLAIGGCLNVLLNLFFVIVLKKDVEGVAIATTASQAVSALLCFITLLKAKGIVKFEAKHFGFHKNEIIKILKIGVPSGIQTSLFAISNVTLQSAINSFGDLAMSGSAYAGQIENYIYLSMNSIAVALMSFVSQNYGARNYERIKKSIIYCLIINVSLGLTIGILAVIFAKPIISLVTTNEEVLDFCYRRISIIGSLYFICGIMDVFTYSMRALGKSLSSMIISLIGACLLRLVWVFTLVELTRSYEMIFWSYPVSWILTAFTAMILVINLMKKTKIKFELEKNNNDAKAEQNA